MALHLLRDSRVERLPLALRFVKESLHAYGVAYYKIFIRSASEGNFGRCQSILYT